jgi:RNA polymerase sigma-70 factor (ECF subfamily)
MRTETDEHLVWRAREGDVAAFEMIVERYRLPLVALAAARLGSVADAEDVAQEAFVQAFFRLHQLRQPAALLPWLRRLAERLALTRLRRRREEPLQPAQVADMRAAEADAGVCDVETAALLQGLPAAMRRTVTLTYLAGYTCAETAALLGVQEGTVKSRLSRARAILKEAFEMTEEGLAKGKPTDEFTQETMDRLMREARRLLESGNVEAAGERAGKVLEMQAKELFARGDAPGFQFDKEAARISGLAYQERRRRDCEANAVQYGYRLEDLDWELEEVNVLSETLGRPVGRGEDIWGVPFSKVRVKMLDGRDICRRLGCSPLTLHDWVQRGCPVIRCWPFVRYDLDRVKQWLKDNRISGWPRESDADTDRPVRAILQAVYRQETTPEQALKIMDGLDLP